MNEERIAQLVDRNVPLTGTYDELRLRARQQATIAELGHRALAGADTQDLIDEVVGVVSTVLEVPYCSVTELQADGVSLEVRGETGWKPGSTANLQARAGKESPAGYALLQRQPLIVEDLDTDDRFAIPQILRDHGVVSSLVVLVHGPQKPYGVLSVHDVVRRTFTEDDVYFAQAVANLLGLALERSRIERNLLHSAAIVDSSDDAVIGKTLEGIITSWNPGAERLYGYAADEVIGRHISVLVPLDRLTELADIMDRLRRGERIDHYETIRVRKDGERIVVSISISPLRDETGTVIGAATIARDVTEQRRREAERSLLLDQERAARDSADAAQRRLAFLADASSALAESLNYETTLKNVARLAVPHIADWCAVDIVDTDGTIRRLAITHVDPEREKLALEMGRRYPPDPHARGGVADVIRSGRPVLVPDITDEMLASSARDPEHLRIMRGVQLRSAIVAPLATRDRVLGAITLVMAESGRRYDEEDLALADTLARRAAVAVDNARLYDEARRALALRDEFISVASHELKTPITALQMQVQLLRRHTGDRSISAEQLDRTLEVIQRQIRRITKLSEDLVHVSRIAAGRLEIEREEIDLTELAREVVTRFSAESAGGNVSIRLHAPGPVVGQFDRFRLDQVLTNLISNAVKYGNGSPVEVTVVQRGDRAHLTVRDDGIGIDQARHAAIFEPFERAVPSRHYGGLGLGLHIVRRILQAHGGSVSVESELGQGSTFLVELPLAPV